MSLLSTSQGSTGGSFKVTAKSSNDDLELVTLTAPLDSALTLDAQTSNAAATVSLHQTFEGAFRLHTSNADIKVAASEQVVDPAGAGRARPQICADPTGRCACRRPHSLVIGYVITILPQALD